MLRVNEVYASIQGEGPLTGVPTIFVRFGGCNLRCPVWPCDTQHAIDPAYRDEWVKTNEDVLADEIKAIQAKTGIRNVCLTGGEPFLQSHDGLKYLVNQFDVPPEEKGTSFEVFTNGTLRWPDWSLSRLQFRLDWKLKGSGEDWTKWLTTLDASDIVPAVLCNLRELDLRDAIKFTIASREDFDEAVALWEAYAPYRHHGIETPTYVGPVWGVVKAEQVAEWLIESGMPWRLNIQTHKYIYGDRRGI